MSSTSGVRLDKWLWAARFFKTRSLASEAIDGGKVSLNGERVKRSKPVSVGDEVRIRGGAPERVVHVRGLSEKRGSAAIAATLYEETEASRLDRERVAAMHKAIGAPMVEGKPSKKERRAIDKFRGR